MLERYKSTMEKRDCFSSYVSSKVRFKSNFFWRLFPAGMRRRWWLFRPFDLVARYWPLFNVRKGLVVVRMDGIGDMVLFRNSLDHYEKVFGISQNEITVLGCKSWGALTDGLFYGYRVIAISEHSYAKKFTYRIYINFLVRRLRPRLVISDSYFRRALITDSLVWVMDAPKSVVSYPYINEKTRPEFTYYLSTVSQIIDTGPYPTHELIRHANFLSEIGPEKIQPFPPSLFWDHKMEIPEEQKGLYIVLSCGSNEVGRRWPLKKFINLAESLVQLGYKVFFVGKGEDQSVRPKLNSHNKNGQIIDLVDKTTLVELVHLIKLAKLVVSNDSGPAHLAIGLGVSTVVLTGGGHYESFVPYPKALTPKNVRFLSEPMDCYHCFWTCIKRQNQHSSFPCVSDIPVASVKSVCEELLSRHC